MSAHRQAPGNPLEAWARGNRGPAVYKWPHYFPVYHRHLQQYRGQSPAVLEFGVLHGGSLRMWRDYFGPGCRVTGADIDPRCKAAEDDQITVATGDQEDPEFLAALAGPWDVIVDDGGHSMGQQIAALQGMWAALADGGTFITEDTHTSYWPSCGGGHLRPGTFAEYAKTMIDRLHAWQSQDPGLVPDGWTRTLAGLHVYDSIIVFDKQRHGPPPEPPCTGTALF